MKIVIINGSARKGNTLAAINAFIKGASEKNEIEIIEPDKLNIAPCKGCGVCQCSKGCVDKDDTNSTIDKIAAADMILFATPVYWWGMSAQLKLIIDKCYCRGLQLKNKKVGTIVVGGSPVGSIQYELIDKQFDCMAKYLSWDMLFKKSYYATARDELEKNKDSMNELGNKVSVIIECMDSIPYALFLYLISGKMQKSNVTSFLRVALKKTRKKTRKKKSKKICF